MGFDIAYLSYRKIWNQVYLDATKYDLARFKMLYPIKRAGLIIAGMLSEMTGAKITYKRKKADLWVDDSIGEGETVKKLRKTYDFKLYCPTVVERNKGWVDFPGMLVPDSQWIILPWDFDILTEIPFKVGYDLDGVLAANLEGDIDSKIDCSKLFSNLKPLLKPKGKVQFIITARYQQDKEITEKWLTKYGIKYDKLIIVGSPEAQNLLLLKAQKINDNKIDIFVESKDDDAEVLSVLTSSLVLCFSTGSAYRGGKRVDY